MFHPVGLSQKTRFPTPFRTVPPDSVSFISPAVAPLSSGFLEDRRQLCVSPPCTPRPPSSRKLNKEPKGKGQFFFVFLFLTKEQPSSKKEKEQVLPGKREGREREKGMVPRGSKTADMKGGWGGGGEEG
eukprot:Hpha_TRINITY_DN16012_c0_g1::TRINITY_DN16012_c0_g1_i1::g.120054::m.120054